MSTYKRLCLLLCSLFMFCVGFLSVSNRAYAYTAEDGFYPLDINEITMQFAINEFGNDLYYNPVYNNGKYLLNNPQLNDIYAIVWYQGGNAGNEFTFPYQPDSYDYYLLGSLTAYCEDHTLSTFKPTELNVTYWNSADNTEGAYELSNTVIYDIDVDKYRGFGFSTKVDFQGAGSSSLSRIGFLSDKDTLGNKPANLVFELGVMAIPKGTSESEINQRILNKLSEMQESLTDSIGSAADQVTDAIEKQYGINPGESFGVQDLTSQVEEKLGVLSFGADTLNNFLGLFQASNAGSTVLTFPGFSIDVQGESYKVWNDIQFDLAFLEENFGFLIDTLRTVTVLCVWLAVLGYLVKAYEHLVNNKG